MQVTRCHYEGRHKKHTLEEYAVALILLNMAFPSAQMPPPMFMAQVEGLAPLCMVLGDRIHCMAVCPSQMVFAFMPRWEESRNIQQNRPGGTRSQQPLMGLSKLKTFCVPLLLFNSQPCKFTYSGIAILKPLYWKWYSAPLYRHLRLCTGRTAHRESRGIAQPFHDYSTRRGWGVSITPQLLFILGKDPVPIVQEAGWAPGPVWTGAENLAFTGIRSPDRPALSQSIYQLSYPDPHYPEGRSR